MQKRGLEESCHILVNGSTFSNDLFSHIPDLAPSPQSNQLNGAIMVAKAQKRPACRKGQAGFSLLIGDNQFLIAAKLAAARPEPISAWAYWRDRGAST